MGQEVTNKPNVIKSLPDTRQSIEPQGFTWNLLNSKHLAPLSPKGTPASASHPRSNECGIERKNGSSVVAGSRHRAPGLTCQRTLLAEAQQPGGRAHWVPSRSVSQNPGFIKLRRYR